MIEYRQYRLPSDEYNQERLLRDLMLRRPLGRSLSAADVEDDHSQTHIGAFIDSRLIACVLILRTDANAARIRQMAVADDVQRQGIGRKLLLLAEDYCRQLGVATITISARKYARGFYEKSGYTIASEEYQSIGISHFRMEKIIQSTQV